MPGIRTLATLIGAVLVGVGPCAAQARDEAPGEQMPVFTDVVEVNVVNVFVTVTDRDGNPVTGLEAGDFEVLEDGHPVAISNFEGVAPEQEGAASAAETAPAAPAGTAPAAVSPNPQRRYLAVLFDGPSLGKRDRRRVIDALGSPIDELVGGGTEILVATAGSELEIVQGFTTSSDKVRGALERVAESRSEGDALRTRRRMLERELYGARIVDPRTPGFSEVQAQKLLTEIEAFRSQELARVKTALSQLHELVRMLGGVGGRTTVLWVGEDLPLQPAVDLYELLFDRFSGEVSLDQPTIWGTGVEVRPDLRSVAETAQGGTIAVSFLDAADLDREMGTADIGAPEPLSAVAAEGGDSVSSMGTDLARLQSATEGESFLAGETGGETVTGTRILAPFLGRVVDMMDSYYSIGYTREGEPDHELHDLEVRVRRPGVKVKTQSRVRAATAEEQLGDIALARLQLDAGGSELAVSLRLGNRRSAEGRRKAAVFDVAIAVPVRSLVVVPVEGGAVAQLGVAIRILDPSGVPSKPQVDRGPVAVPSGATQVEFSLPLMIPDGTSRIAVAVRDDLSGAAGSAVIDVPN